MIFPVWKGYYWIAPQLWGNPKELPHLRPFAGSRDHLKMAQQLFQLVGAGGP